MMKFIPQKRHGMVSVPRSMTPMVGGKKMPVEHPAMLTAAEAHMLKLMTDGQSNKTQFGGVPSFTDPSQSRGNNLNSTPTRTTSSPSQSTPSANRGGGASAMQGGFGAQAFGRSTTSAQAISNAVRSGMSGGINAAQTQRSQPQQNQNLVWRANGQPLSQNGVTNLGAPVSKYQDRIAPTNSSQSRIPNMQPDASGDMRAPTLNDMRTGAGNPLSQLMRDIQWATGNGPMTHPLVNQAYPTNLSSANMLAGGYGQYPSGRPQTQHPANTTHPHMGTNYSTADMAAAYGGYRQPPGFTAPERPNVRIADVPQIPSSGLTNDRFDRYPSSLGANSQKQPAYAGAATPSVSQYADYQQPPGIHDPRVQQYAQGGLTEVGNFKARGAQNVDPRLRSMMQDAAILSGQRVDAFSGFRPGDPRAHGKGLATDVRIMGPDGKPVPNYQNGAGFPTYQKYANQLRDVQQQQHPELNDKLRWGGYFGGAPGKYGAMDAMHFDLAGSPTMGMLGGSWGKGLNKKQAEAYGITSNVGSKTQVADAGYHPSGPKTPTGRLGANPANATPVEQQPVNPFNTIKAGSPEYYAARRQAKTDGVNSTPVRIANILKKTPAGAAGYGLASLLDQASGGLYGNQVGTGGNMMRQNVDAQSTGNAFNQDSGNQVKTDPATGQKYTINPVTGAKMPWYYPQYEQTWAGLPSGLGGYIG